MPSQPVKKDVTVFYKVVTTDRWSPFNFKDRHNRRRFLDPDLEPRIERYVRVHFYDSWRNFIARRKDLAHKLKYNPGAIVRAHEFDQVDSHECSAGINGFLLREDAQRFMHNLQQRYGGGFYAIIRLAAHTRSLVKSKAEFDPSAKEPRWCRAPVVKVLD